MQVFSLEGTLITISLYKVNCLNKLDTCSVEICVPYMLCIMLKYFSFNMKKNAQMYFSIRDVTNKLILANKIVI